MKTKRVFFCLIAILVIAASCAPAEDTGAETDTAMTDAAASENPLSGTWSGDWGPSAEHRNPVTLALNWDGTALTGTVNPGPDAIQLSSATFDPATGEVTMQADATNFRGEDVHYVIEGRVEGDSMTGTWTHDATAGDFSISR